MMKQAVSPLIHEIKRWDMGFRVKYGYRVGKVLVMGWRTHKSVVLLLVFALLREVTN